MPNSIERRPPDAGACLEALGAVAFSVAGFLLGPFEGCIAIGASAWALALAFGLRHRHEVDDVDAD